MFGKEIDNQQYSKSQSRDEMDYLQVLFPDSLTTSSGCNIFLALMLNVKLKMDDNDMFYFKANAIVKNKEVSLNKIASITGGQNEFFKPGAQILDIGSGAGVAVQQMSDEYPHVTFVGLDLLYTSRTPADRGYGHFVGGDWKKLPFKDAEFTGLLALDTFPADAEGMEDFENTFKDITRVSRPGAVWRGTHKQGRVNRDPENTALVNCLTDNGWDVFINNHKFIAKLVNKKLPPLTELEFI